MNIWAKRILRAAAVASATMMLAVPLAGPASAATPRNGVCEEGEFCLFWGTGAFNGQTAVSDFTTSIPEYGDSQPTCYEFKGDYGADVGRAQCIKNNAASAWNRRTGTVRLYTQPHCQGAERWVIKPGQIINDLSPLKERNQSHSVASSGTC